MKPIKPERWKFVALALLICTVIMGVHVVDLSMQRKICLKELAA